MTSTTTTTTYSNEKEGQIAFFNKFNINYEIAIQNYTDGIWNGNIFELKLNIKDQNTTLFQVIKYLSKMRINGKPIPTNIILVDLNLHKANVYKSSDYLKEIENIYIGSASVGNSGFKTKKSPTEFNYSQDITKLQFIINSKNYTKINIDNYCVCGWAKTFYNLPENKNKKQETLKELFLKDDGELRKPNLLKEHINPYTKKDNGEFKYLMDKLNDKMLQKEIGAFYTPIPYCRLGADLVREAIKQIPNGNDYIILDRCAGTGNLESVLTDEELSHCICSTYEHFEYLELINRLGDEIRYIIPPFEEKEDDLFGEGKVKKADAMSKEYVENELLKAYISNDLETILKYNNLIGFNKESYKCNIIIFENPPFRDMTSNTSGTAKKGFTNFIKEQMKTNLKGATLNDISNLFIWSAFKYYLRDVNDSYIIYSPIKYWKSCHIVGADFKSGYILNRQHFHATPSAISLIWWQNSLTSQEQNSLNLKVIDIELQSERTKIMIYKETGREERITEQLKGQQEQTNYGKIKEITNMEVKKVYKTFADNKDYWDKRKDNNIACINLSGFNLDSNSVMLYTTRDEIKGHGSCFNLQRDNFVKKLPLFCAKLYFNFQNWYENGTIFTTADKGNLYEKDNEFLRYCFIYTCLSYNNKCISFTGSDNRYYKNELCFDNDTIASAHLLTLILNDDEKELKEQWDKILSEAKKCHPTEEIQKENIEQTGFNGVCNNNLSYGLYQIDKELNIKIKKVNPVTKKMETVVRNSVLNGEINTLKTMLKIYYKKYIIDKLFEYGLLK